jgi:glycosyltransferase involved in cell wall biosynthesis
MRIGIDVRLWNETGVGRYIRNLVMNLVSFDDRNEYVLFTRKQDKDKIKKLIAGKKAWKVVPVDIRWHTVTEQFLFASVINKEDLDMMHFPYFSLPILYRKPFVVTIHDLIIHHFNTGKASTLPLPVYQVKRLGYEQVLKYAVNKGKKIIVPLRVVQKDLVNAFHVPEVKIAVTPEGFDTDLQKKQTTPVSLPFKRYFLYVGNAYPHKNLNLLLKAFLDFQTKHPEKKIGLVLAGKDSYFYKELRERLKKEQQPAIIIINDVSDPELAYLYQHAICLTSPSLMEGFGLTALEALALSCLPVVSDIPAFHEVCENGAVYFNPTSVKSMREKMEVAESMSAKERSAYLKRGKARIALYSWRTMAEQTLAVYEESIRSTKRTRSIKSRLLAPLDSLS